MKIWTASLSAVVVAAVLVSGCANTTQTKDVPNRPNAVQQVIPNPNPNPVPNPRPDLNPGVHPNVNPDGRPQSIPYSVRERTMGIKQATDRLEKVARKVPEVRQATAIIIGNTAIVGLDLKKKTDRKNVDSIKSAVAKALRKERFGANAVITADTDIGQRIKNVRDGMVEGRPFSAFTNELGDLIGRVAPQMSR